MWIPIQVIMRALEIKQEREWTHLRRYEQLMQERPFQNEDNREGK